MLSIHLKYYDLIRHPASFPTFSFPYKWGLLLLHPVYPDIARGARVPIDQGFRSTLSDRVVAHTPKAS